MNLNIFDSVTYYVVDLDKLDEETKKQLSSEYGFFDGDDTIAMTLHDIDRYGIDSDAVHWDTADFNEDELEWLLESYLNSHPYYLVFASGCRWDGASGYKFCDDIKDTVYRDYDTSISIEDHGPDCIKCRESSHDVPMGSTTIIIGLDSDDYEKLESADFDTIKEFAMSKFK